MFDFAVLSGFLTVYGVLILFGCAVSIALFVLNGLGIFKMHKKMEFKNGWFAFIPILYVFALGKIAEKYVKQNGKKSAKFSIILLLVNIIRFIVAVLFLLFTVIAVFKIIAEAETAIANETQMVLEMFYSLIPVIALYFVLFAFAVTYNILYYVALWRVFSIFNDKNATLFTVLSVFFNFLAPIFIFIVSKNEPKLTFYDRIGSFDFENSIDG